MLSIRLGKAHFLDIKKKIGVTIQLANMMFSDDLDYGEFINTISVPANEANSHIFKNIHTEDDYLTTYESEYFIPDYAEIFKNTVKFVDGRFELKQATESHVDLDIISGIKSLNFANEKLSDLLALPDCVSEAICFYCEEPEELIQHAIDQNNSGISKYVFPVIKNLAFYGDANPTWSGYLNRWDATNQTFYLNTYTTGPPTITNSEALCPQLKLIEMIKIICTYHNIKVDGDFISDADQQDLLIYNNRSLDKLLQMDALFCHRNAGSLGLGGGQVIFEFEYANGDPYNCHNTVTGEVTIFRSGVHIVYVATPFDGTNVTDYTGKIKKDGVEVYSKVLDRTNRATMFMRYVFEAPASDIGKKLTFFLYKADGTDLYYGAGLPLPYLRMDIENPDAGLNRYNTFLHMKDHVPDMTFSDFLSRLKKGLGLNIDLEPSTGTIFFNYIKNKITEQPSENYTEIAENKYLKKIIGPQIKSIGFAFPDDDDISQKITTSVIDTVSWLGDFFTFDDLPTATVLGQKAFIINTGIIAETVDDSGTMVWINKDFYYPKQEYNDDAEQVVEINATPLMMALDFDSLGTKSLKPWVHQRGSTDAYGIGNNNNTELRLFYWKGMQPNSNLELYPLASSTSYDTVGVDLGGYELRIEGNRGLQENFWGSWYASLNVGVVWTRKFFFNILHLLKFKAGNTFICGNHKFIPQSAQINVESGKEIIEVEMDYIEILP